MSSSDPTVLAPSIPSTPNGFVAVRQGHVVLSGDFTDEFGAHQWANFPVWAGPQDDTQAGKAYSQPNAIHVVPVVLPNDPAQSRVIIPQGASLMLEPPDTTDLAIVYATSSDVTVLAPSIPHTPWGFVGVSPGVSMLTVNYLDAKTIPRTAYLQVQVK
jgi:hypothetical protein